MDQGMNPSQNTNRFIFSNEFYDNLAKDNEVPEEEKVSFDIPQMAPEVETQPEEPKEIIETQAESLSGVSFTNPISNDIKTDVENNELFDIPEVPPKVETTSQPLTGFFFNNQAANNETKPEEPLVELELPDLNFEKVNEEVITEPVVEQSNPPEEVELQQTEINLSEQPLETTDLKPISSFEQPIEENNNFDVPTSINTNLDQERLKSKIQMEAKAPIVQNNTWLEPKTEKVVYRARRNNPSSVINNFREEIKPEKVEPPRISPLLEPYQSTTIITEKDINPSVINIDLELQKEAELQERIDNAETDFVIEENFDVDMPVTKSDLLNQLMIKEQQTGKISILARYGENFCSRDYVTNPAIGRNEEIKQLILILLTPEKSGILVGKPGIGKTSIVEGLAYRLQRGKVPEALKGYTIISIKTTSLLGTLPTGETRLQTLIDELKELDKIILFVDEIHMLMGATSESSLDFANMFKESLGRGSIKMIGATTNDEYERYVLRDKAFVRRFQRVDVEEPSREQTIQILMGTLPKIEKNTGARLKYTSYLQSEIMAFIVDITTEYKRVYGIGSRYPDICLTLLSQAFSQAVFDNRKEVNILDIRNAIENSKNIYPDVIRKELVNFDNKFKQLINEEKAM